MGDEQMGRPLKKPAAAPELMPLSIRSQSISHEVIRSLTKYFFSGGFAPGQRLPSERELAVSLGVPRSVVRAAVQSLGLLGALDIRQGDGTYLRRGQEGMLTKVIEWGLFLGEARLFDLVEARCEVEPVLAGFAAARQTAEELADLRRMLKVQASADISVDDFVEVDIAFHLQIAAMSKNTVLRDVLTSITSLLRVWMTRSLRAANGTRTTFNEHVVVFDRIAEGNVSGAGEGMRTHLTCARLRLERTLDQEPLLRN